MRCGPAKTGRAQSRSDTAAGVTDVRMRSEASRVGDSSRSTSRVPAVSLRRAPSASAWVRAARPALATPSRECVAHWRRDEPVTSRTPARISATTSTSTPTRPMNGLSDGPLRLTEEAAVGAHVLVTEERVHAVAGEDPERIGGGCQGHSGHDQHDTPAQAAPRSALLSGDKQVGGEPEEQGQDECKDAHQPASGVAEPAAEGTAVPPQIQYESEEHGDGETRDRTQLPAVPGDRELRLRSGGRAGGAPGRLRRGARAPTCLFRACGRHEALFDAVPRIPMASGRLPCGQTSTTTGMTSGRLLVRR